MVRPLLTYLARHWRGPAVAVEVAGQRPLMLGSGEPQATVIIRHPRGLRRIASLSLLFGEAYMDGGIEVHGDLQKLLQGFYETSERLKAAPLRRLAARLRTMAPRRISVSAATRHARHHYDVGNDFFSLWLDPSLTYSCAYFARPNDDLLTAQRQKLDLICRKAALGSGQRLLDVGCGWGSLLWHAAENYGVRATGVTPTHEQARFIADEAKRRGLSDQVSVIDGDWRHVKGTYDRVVSVGMFEHVGTAQYRQFFQRWHDLLTPDGMGVLHTIGRLTPGQGDPWIRRYVFPGGELPALAEISSAAGAAGLRTADVENLWRHYVLTLQHWSANFSRARERVVARYGERFARMWWLYLQAAEASFRWGGLQLWQVIFLREQARWPLNPSTRRPRP